MAHANSFTRVNILAVFLLATILFSSVADLNNESFAVSSEVITSEKIIQKTAVHHSINLSESMNLSSPEGKKNSETTNVDVKNNLTSIIFEEDLEFTSNTSQTESTTIYVKNFSDRNGMLERILLVDRLRPLDKSSTKNYLDSELQSFSNDNYLSNFIDTFSADLLNSVNIVSELKLDNISSFKIVDTNDPTGIVFLALISSLIFVRSENQQIKFDGFKKIFSYGFILLLISSAVISPASISSSYWGVAYGEEMENTNSSDNNVGDISTDYTNDTIPLESSDLLSTIPEDSNNFLLPEINYNDTSVNSTIDVVDVVENNNLVVENYTAPIAENYTVPIIENYTEPIIENFTEPIIENYTEPIIENFTEPIIENYTEPIIIPNATESWEFDTQVNGSQFVGNVHIENETGLVLEGDGYVTNDGNSTSNISNLTITAWVKPYYANGSAELTVVSKENTFELTINNVIDPQRVAKFSIFDGIKQHTVTSLTTFGENWSHIAVTFNGTLLSMYTNGTLSNEKIISDTITLTSDGQLEPITPELVTSSSDVVVGASLDNTRSIDDVSKKFSGEIYDVNIFDIYLSAEQIAEIYNSTYPSVFNATNSTDIDTTQTNSTNDIPIEEIETIDVLEDIISIEIDNSTDIDNLSNYTKQDTSIELNGTETFVSIEEEQLNDELNQLTVSAFIKPNYTSGSAEFAILSKENSFTLSLNNIISPEHLPKFSVFDGISWVEIIGSTQIEDWSHLVATINHTTISLYVNGTLEDTANLSEPIFVSGDQLQLTTSEIMTSDSDLVIGAYISTSRGETTLSNHFSGSIDDILIYKEILTESQINEIYSELVEQQKLELEISLIEPIKIQNITSTLNHTEIIIGEPVKWIQTIQSEEDILNIEVEIPADAQNIQVEVLEDNDESLKISQDEMDIVESKSTIESETAERILLESVSMDKIDQVLQEDKDTKLVVIEENSTEYSLEFETPAPYTLEEDNSNDDMFNKTVTVAHDSALHYTDVRSYSDLPENLVYDGIEFSLFWIINGTKTDVTNDPRFQVEFVDTNNNGILDRMFWTVPQLSEQVFEIIGGSSSQSSSTECQDVFLNFEGIPHGAPLSYINNLPQFKDNGINLIAPYNESGPYHTFIIFDSDESRTSDYDLEVDEGNIIIVPENDDDNNGDGIFDDPDDHPAGGIQVFEFDHPRIVKSFVFVDHDNNNFARATAFDADGNVIKYVNIPNGGESSVQIITMNAANTSRLDIEYHDSGAVGQIDLSCSAQGSVTLSGLIRDFKDSHPDFQHIIGDDDGIVKLNLGDGNGAESDNPAHAKVGATVTTTSADNFNQWYKNFENINQCKEFDITLNPNNNGIFEFSDSTFFPIDGELFGNQGRQHNYHFTYEMRGTFEFDSGQTIQVNGDDDIWIFVNHTLIYDGGGVLPPRDSGLLELDLLNVSESLGLIEGQEYDIDIFFAERHTVLSVFEIETNINIIQKILSCDDGQDFEITLEETLEFTTEFDSKIEGNAFEETFSEELSFTDDSEFTKQQEIQVDITETLSFTDDSQFTKQQNIQVDLTETLSFTDDSEFTKQQEIQVDIIETLSFTDDSQFTKQQNIQVDIIETLSFTDDSEFTKQQNIQVDLTETLSFDDVDISLQRDCHIFIEETLNLDDSDSTQHQQNLQINLQETLFINDTTQQKNLHINLQETLTLNADTDKQQNIQVDLTETLVLQDTKIVTPGDKVITLDETLDLQDTKFDSPNDKQLTLVETLDLNDSKLDTPRDKAITLDETLDLQDTKLDTPSDKQLTLVETLDLQETKLDTSSAKGVTLDETLDLQDTKLDTTSDKAITLIEILNLQDTELVCPRNKAITLDETLDLQDTKLDTANDKAITLIETLDLQDSKLDTPSARAVTLDETLNLQDTKLDTPSARGVTLDEVIILDDTSISNNNEIQLNLVETLDLNDTKFDNPMAKEVILDENILLEDTSISNNNEIQLNLVETLILQDTKLDNPCDKAITLDETLDLQDTKLDTPNSRGVILDETLDLQDTKLDTANDKGVILDEVLTLVDTSVTNNNEININLDETLDLQDIKLDTASNKGVTLVETLVLKDSQIVSIVNDQIQLILDEILDLKDEIGFNSPPSANDDTDTIDEDTVLNVLASGVLANDTDPDTVDTKTVTAVNGISSNVGIQITLASGALLTLNSDGSYTYDPNNKFENLGAGDSVIDSFTYTMSDTAGETASATVTFTITGVNDAPFANIQTVFALQGIPKTITLTGFDIDIEPLTFTIASGPSSGTLGSIVSVGPTSATIVYTPNPSFSGPDSFSFTVSDGNGASSTAIVTVNVTPSGGAGPTGSGGSGGGGSGGGGGTGASPTTPSTPPGVVGFPGILSPKTTGFGTAKFFGFDVQFNDGNPSSQSGGGCFIDANQTLTVSVGVTNPFPINRAELRFVYEDDSYENYTRILMNETNSNEETSGKLSGTIPWKWLENSDGIRYWIYVLDEDDAVSESDKFFMGVKPGHSPLHDDLEVAFVQAEGTILEPYAFITNSISESARGHLSLVVNGTKVQNITNIEFKYGTTYVPFTWEIPKTWDKLGRVVDYPIKVVGEFCSKVFESEEVILSSFPEFIIKPLPEFQGVNLLNNTAGKTVAVAESIHSSDNDPNVRFTVTSPDGTCVIGAADNCKIKDSTFDKRGNTEKIKLGNQIYSVQYSGSEQDAESFTIRSIESIHGKWNIEGSADSDVICKYRAIVPELSIRERLPITPTTTGFVLERDAPWWLPVVIAEIIAGIILTMITGANQNRYLFLQEKKTDLINKSRKVIGCLI